MKSRRPITAAELMAKLKADPEFQQREAAKDRARDERRKALDELLKPFLSELHALGLHGDSLHEIVKAHSPIPAEGVDILLSALAALSDPRQLESVVRALGAAETIFDGRPLVRCFEATNDDALKWAIANTIALTHPHSIDDWLSELCKSPYWAKTLRDLGF